MARAHASEHSLSARSAVKEVQAAATLLDTFDLSNDERPSTKNPLIPAHKAHPPGGALVIQFRRPACQSIHSHGLPIREPFRRNTACLIASWVVMKLAVTGSWSSAGNVARICQHAHLPRSTRLTE
jgi:hypothetical protein